jgi:ubiquinone/menaquinone biosynthesis C-methylase UbiE
MIDFSIFETKNNDVFITDEITSFSEAYLKVREKEQRILSDDDVLKLPHLNKFEWPQRVKSTKRFIDYISKKKQALTILDLGCGNGWFTNKIAEISKQNTIVGIDINKEELEQATRLFKAENIKFVYANVFECNAIFKDEFDIISINGSIQYFEDFEGLITQLKKFLKPGGEIHIIDSPFYKTDDIPEAKKRTLEYYTKLGVPEMAQFYYHHSVMCVKNFSVLYKNKTTLFRKFLKSKDSPFMWLKFTKH